MRCVGIALMRNSGADSDGCNVHCNRCLCSSMTTSPCIKQCALNQQQVCTGCGRTIGEIKNWGQMSDEQRNAVMLRLRREANRDPREASLPEVRHNQ